MPAVSSDFVHRIRAPGYLVLTLLILLPIAQILVAAWPFQFHVLGWRLNVVTAATAGMPEALFGLLLLFALAVAAADKGVLWTLAALCGLGALMFVIGAGGFSLDALQTKAQVREAAATRYDLDAAWLLLKVCLAALVLVVLTVSSYRAARGLQREVARASGRGSPLLVGTAPGMGAPPDRGSDRSEVLGSR